MMVIHGDLFISYVYLLEMKISLFKHQEGICIKGLMHFCWDKAMFVFCETLCGASDVGGGMYGFWGAFQKDLRALKSKSS